MCMCMCMQALELQQHAPEDGEQEMHDVIGVAPPVGYGATDADARIFTFGSYRLGVHGPGDFVSLAIDTSNLSWL